jgi:hypothetical protein
MQHVYPTLFPELDESRRALQAISAYTERITATAHI